MRARRLTLEALDARRLLAADFAALAGRAYSDADGNGQFGPAEVGLAGLTIQLSGTNDLGQTVQRSATTAADDPATLEDETGLYRFDGLRAGSYVVTQPPPPPGGHLPLAAVSRNVTITAQQAAGVAGSVVDRFDQTRQVVQASLNTVLVDSSSQITAPGEALGDERDLFVQLDSATGSVMLAAHDNEPGVLAIDPSSSAEGSYVITWDGPDGDPTALDPVGLGGEDLTDQGRSTTLRLQIGVDKPNEQLRLRVYTDAANWSEAVATIPFTTGAPTAELLVPFASFTVGGGAGADFAFVGAVELRIDPTVAAMDGQIDLLEALGPTVLVHDFANVPSLPGIQLVKSVNGQDANTATGPLVAAGAAVTFDYVVTNTGNVPLANVGVVDDNGTASPADDFAATPVSSGGFNVGDTDRDAQLDLTETWRFTASRAAVVGQYRNNAVVTGRDPLGTNVTDADPAHYFGAASAIDLVKSVNGADANAATGPIVAAGSVVTWTFVATNTGNVTLSDVRVVDDNGTPGNAADDIVVATGVTLAPGQSRSFTLTGTAIAGQYRNNAVVTGRDPLGTNVTDADPAHYFGAAPAIDLVKSVNGADANSATGPLVARGSAVTWTYVVTNTGNVALNDVRLVDDNGTSNNTADDVVVATGVTLAPGASRTFTQSGTAVAGQYRNDAVVTGRDGLGTTVTDTDPAHYFGAVPAIDLVKSVNGVDANSATGPLVARGSAVTWTYVVTNTGNVALSDVRLVDDNGTPNNTADDVVVATGVTLAPGASRTFTQSGTAVAGQYRNDAVVTGRDPLDATVTDTDPAHYFGAAPAIDLEKLVLGDDADTATGPVVDAGSLVSWTYVVTNTGNVPLSDVRVVDDNGTPNNAADDVVVATGVTLAVGERRTFAHDDTAVTGAYRNDAVVTGRDSVGTSVTDTDPAHYFGAAPALTLKKATNGVDADVSPGPLVATGSQVTWSFVVTNTGNVRLVDVEVVDDNGTPADAGDDVIVATGVTLEPGQSRTFSFTGTATAGQYENLGTATGFDERGTPVDASDPSHYFGAAPAIELKKATNGQDADTAPGPSVPTGSTVTWTYVVRNTGNVPLTGVRITDDNGTPGNVADDFTVVTGVSLAVGESRTFTQTGTAITGQYRNEAVAVGAAATGQTVSDGDPSHYSGQPPVRPQAIPGIELVKSTNGQDANAGTGPFVAVGSVVTWTYVVRNTGNTAVTLRVVDDNGTPGNAADDFVVANNVALALGATLTFTQTGVAAAGQYSNVAVATAVDPDGVTATDSDPSRYFGVQAGVDIEKAVNGQDADVGPGPTITFGTAVTFTYVVTNRGNVALGNVRVTDDRGVVVVFVGGDTDNDGLLDVNETWTYRGDSTAVAGAYVNLGTVLANPVQPDGTDIAGLADVTDTDPANYFGQRIVTKRRFLASF